MREIHLYYCVDCSTARVYEEKLEKNETFKMLHCSGRGCSACVVTRHYPVAIENHNKGLYGKILRHQFMTND